MDFRTDRLGLLVDQLRTSADMSRERFAGLTDDEFRWEPAAETWSIRRRGEANSKDPYGPGEWLLDFERGGAPGAPLTTIAWRLGHLQSMYAGRSEWTFGGRAADPHDLVDFSPHAGVTLDALWAAVDRWLADIDTLTDAQLDQVGFGQYPYGLDPTVPFAAILWWMNREFIHHAAEVALLRDLYARR